MLQQKAKLLAHRPSIQHVATVGAPRRAVFLDRDGTLNVDVGYLARAQDWVFTPQAPAAIRRLRAAGFLILVVTNQSGLARGLIAEAELDLVHAHAQTLLARKGAAIDRFYVSPYHPDFGVERYRHLASTRKPELGMFLQARRDYWIDVTASWMIGDKPTDMEFAQRAGLRSILVARTKPRELRVTAQVEQLEQAAEHILSHPEASRGQFVGRD